MRTDSLQLKCDGEVGSSGGAAAGLVVGVLLAIGLAGLLLLGLLGRPEATSPEVEASEEAGEDDLASELVVMVQDCRRRGDSLWTAGLIRNDGTVTVRYVDISLTWTDSLGAEVVNEINPAVGSESLMPGESTTFSFPTGDPDATDCSARLFNYEPTP